jgi:hypothetical protein
LAVDDIGESSLQAAQGFLGCLALEALALVVGTSGAVRVADLGDGCHVDGVVESAVPAAREPVTHLIARGRFDRGRAVVGGEVVGVGEALDIADFCDDPPGDDGPHTEDLGELRPRRLDEGGDLAAALFDAPVERTDIAQVVEPDLETELTHFVVRTQPEQDLLCLLGAELAPHAAGGQLGQEPVKPADRLGPQRGQLFSTIAEQAQADRGVVGAHRRDPLSVQGRESDRDRIVSVGLSSVALGVHAHAGGQPRRNVEDQLPVTDQALRQRAAGAVAAFDGPTTILPASGEGEQELVAPMGIGEPRTIDRGPRDRVEHSQRVAGLMRVHADQDITFHLSSLL